MHFDPTGPDFYEILGVPATATTEVITKAWRQAVRRAHPDGRPASERDTAHLEVRAASGST